MVGVEVGADISIIAMIGGGGAADLSIGAAEFIAMAA
eukprot:SAG31_NODE_3961_length_3709_cov_7.355721_3_plen_37_part_00